MPEASNFRDINNPRLHSSAHTHSGCLPSTVPAWLFEMYSFRHPLQTCMLNSRAFLEQLCCRYIEEHAISYTFAPASADASATWQCGYLALTVGLCQGPELIFISCHSSLFLVVMADIGGERRGRWPFQRLKAPGFSSPETKKRQSRSTSPRDDRHRAGVAMSSPEEGRSSN